MVDKKKELLKLYKKATKYENELMCTIGELGRVASEIYGKPLTAALCNDFEIEFREDGDSFSTILIEDLLTKKKE